MEVFRHEVLCLQLSNGSEKWCMHTHAQKDEANVGKQLVY